jgi:hypothetical protein
MSETTKPQRRPRHPMPPFIQETLMAHGVWDAYLRRPPYQRNDYIGWITRARLPVTQAKRLAQMLAELAAGDAYMGMPYRAKDAVGTPVADAEER